MPRGTKEEPPKASTIIDVARVAGVSIGTVSRAFRKLPGLKESTRQRVLAAAEQVGYDLGKVRPVKMRRIAYMVDRQHHSLAYNPFYSPVLRAFEESCRANGVTATLSTIGREDSATDLIRQLDVDGVLFVGYAEQPVLNDVARAGRPVVLVDHRASGFVSVNADNVHGAHQAVTHLIHGGRQRIAFISGPIAHPSVAERLQGYRAALRDAHVPHDPTLEVSLTRFEDMRSGYESMQLLLNLPQLPDAVFAYNDETALAAMRACRDARLAIPTQLAFVGFDDVAGAAMAQPPLTTVRVDKEMLAREGVQLLLNLQAGAVPEVVVPTELIVRSSSTSQFLPASAVQ